MTLMQTLPSQLPFATDYFRQLATLSENFEATDKESQPLSFPEAISLAATWVSQQSQQQKK
jgi:D-sedoheptulose 7-phosphate isomerase